MNSNNNIIDAFVQLSLNNKISKIEAFSLLELLKNEKEHAFLKAKLTNMLIPPENVLKVVKEEMKDEKHEKLPLIEKIYYLVEFKQNVECASWLKTTEPLEFDFQPLLMSYQAENIITLMNRQLKDLECSPLPEFQKNELVKDILTGSNKMLKELNEKYKK